MASSTSRDMRLNGADPQYLIPQIVRDKIFNSRFWKEQCFALNAETIITKAKHLDHVGFSYGGFNRPSPFLCLLAKMLQISPDYDTVKLYLEFSEGRPTNDAEEQICDLRYLRALTVTYIRLVGRPHLAFQELEPLFRDFRRLIVIAPSGQFEKITIDTWVAHLLDHRNTPLYGFVFPIMSKRSVVRNRNEIADYVSPLEKEL